MTPLQRARAALGYSQQRVADELRDLAWQHGHGELGIDANAVSRHERGVIGRPRDPLPELYARLYGTSVAALWPGQLSTAVWKFVRGQGRAGGRWPCQAIGSFRYSPQAQSRASSGVPIGRPLGSTESW
jgi:hypothetical protein